MSFLSDEILRPSREPYPEYTQAIDLYYRKVLRRPPPFDMSREEVDSSGFWQSQEFIDETMRGVPGFNYRRFEEPRDAGRGFVPMDVMMRQAEASVKKWLAERAEQERRNPAVTPAAIPLAGPTANTAASQAISLPVSHVTGANAVQNASPAAKQQMKKPLKKFDMCGDDDREETDQESGLSWTGDPVKPENIDDCQPVNAKEWQKPQQRYMYVREVRNLPEGQAKPERRYYVIGERILDRWPLKGEKKFYHAQFIANDGANIGHFPDGFREDDKKNLHLYTYRDEKRYDAETLERAMQIYDERRKRHHQDFQRVMESGHRSTHLQHQNYNFSDYTLSESNCQHYVADVLKIYDELMAEKNQ